MCVQCTCLCECVYSMYIYMVGGCVCFVRVCVYVCVQALNTRLGKEKIVWCVHMNVLVRAYVR